MTINTMPFADTATKLPLESVAPSSALQRWNPAVMLSEKDDDRTISILDVIGEVGDGRGVTARRIMAALRAVGGKDVVVNINSPGGNVFEGLAIYNALRDYKGKVTVNILGLAASAASLIAMAGDEVRIGRSAFIMMHNSWVLASGDKHALRKAANWLEPFDESIASVYAAKSGQKQSDVVKMLDKETWIGGQKAVDMGFADSLLKSDDVKVSAAAEDRAIHATRLIDNLLAQHNIPRKERREMLRSLKTGTHDAAENKQDAVLTGLSALIQNAKSMKGN